MMHVRGKTYCAENERDPRVPLADSASGEPQVARIFNLQSRARTDTNPRYNLPMFGSWNIEMFTINVSTSRGEA
jgi:hypothetical protein